MVIKMTTMKKIFYFISVIVLLSACKEELEGIVPEVNVPEGTQKVELPEVIYATMADEQNDEDTVKTRTYVGLDGRSVLWHGGDAICYCADHVLDSKYVLKGDGGVSSAEFAHENTVQTSTYPVPFSLGVYPYDSNLTPSYGNKGQLGEYNPEYDQEAYPPYCFIDVTYPATQTYAPNSFGRGANMMVAVGKNSTDENLYFKNANGFLVIQLYGVDSSVKSITLRANTSTDYLSGWAGMEIYSDGNFNISKWNENNRSNTVTLDCNNGGEGVKINADKQSSTDFWFALPPMTLNGGFEVEVTDMNDLTYSMKTTQDVEIRRKEVKRMAAFRVEQTAPMPNQIWYTQAPEVTTPTTFNVSKPFGDDVNIVGQTYNEERGIFVIQLDKPVTQIVDNAFRGNEGIKDVILPEGLVTIGNSAFKFSSLKSIIIPGTVTLIGEDTFYGCSNLEEVHFQQGISTLTIYPIHPVINPDVPQFVGPFSYSPLKIINLNRNIKYPDAMYESHYTEGIFAENSSVTGNVATTINIGSNVTTLPEYIFAGCD